ncbi:MAG: hypothetical protein Q8L26_08685 [Candidatus Omnitrophota bacterium]|nr:hypothetical protein [Candidatus Omnitrophota bacterium]
MSKIMPICLLVLGYFLLWLLYINRSSTKIQEATIIIAGVIIGALFYVTKEETLERAITSVYFIEHKESDFNDNKNNEDKKIRVKDGFLFFPDKPGLGQYYRLQSGVFGNYLRRSLDSKTDVIFNMPQEVKPLLDIQAIAILGHLSMFYGHIWHVTGTQKEVPSGTMGEYHLIEIENVKNDISRYEKDKLPISLKQNMFFNDLNIFRALAMPKGTKIYYSTYNNSAEYRFYKRFFFDIRIKINYQSYTVGLGQVAYFLGLNTEEKDFNELYFWGNDYGNLALVTNCKATFSRWTAWNPSSVRYKNWANNLFNDLYNTFDWSICYARMKEYQQSSANQKIINKLK